MYFLVVVGLLFRRSTVVVKSPDRNKLAAKHRTVQTLIDAQQASHSPNPHVGTFGTPPLSGPSPFSAHRTNVPPEAGVHSTPVTVSSSAPGKSQHQQPQPHRSVQRRRGERDDNTLDQGEYRGTPGYAGGDGGVGTPVPYIGTPIQ